MSVTTLLVFYLQDSPYNFAVANTLLDNNFQINLMKLFSKFQIEKLDPTFLSKKISGVEACYSWWMGTQQ